MLIVMQLGMALGYNTEFSHNFAVQWFNVVPPYRSIQQACMRDRALCSCMRSPRAVLVPPLFFRAARLRDAFAYVERIAAEHGDLMHLTSEKGVAFEALANDARSLPSIGSRIACMLAAMVVSYLTI